MNTKKTSIYELTHLELMEELAHLGLNKNLSKFVTDKIYKFKNSNGKSLPLHFFERLENHFCFKLPTISKVQNSTDGTIKFLLELKDSNKIECVLIPFHKKYTLCLSTQVGCAMNCSFCFTGTMGLKRHLSASEIISQYIIAYKFVLDRLDEDAPLPNIVFMGQGEPLHNFENVKKALSIFLDSHCLHLGPRQITLSTAGYIPGLLKFNELFNINLAISFHSATNEKRNLLIPLNNKFPIENLLEVLKTIKIKKRQYITFEYLLIKDFNDTNSDARMLADRLKDFPAIVNLIAFNPFPGSNFKRPEDSKIEEFKSWLVELKLRTMIRNTKGDEILAACGQLNT